MYPKLSIVTPSLNQGKYIEETILSVRNQKYPNYEHIIIDGGSTDETVNIVKKYPNITFVYEKDNGMTDAINKGLRIASGEYIGWINSDDYYAENVFYKIVELFRKDEVDWIVGNIAYRNEEDESLRKNTYFPEINYMNLLNNPDIVKQPGTFYSMEILKQVGYLNDKYRMVMDYDLFIRISNLNSPLMYDKVVAIFRNHPDQKTGRNNAQRNMWIQLSEIFRIMRREGVGTINRLIILRKKIIDLIKICCLLSINSKR